MGAVAAETERIAIGALVARATLRPPAVLANGFDTVARIVGADRLIAGIGAGDEESRVENESFGIGFGPVEERIVALRDAVDATVGHGYPVWVGGRDPAVRELAASRADGWNRWGAGLERFRAQAANLRVVAVRSHHALAAASSMRTVLVKRSTAGAARGAATRIPAASAKPAARSTT